MRSQSFEFLRGMIEVPSPSGYEERVQDYIAAYVRPFADRVERDVHGNLTAILQPEGRPRVMLAGHCDEIGLVVKYLTDQGMFHFAAVGGIDVNILPARRVHVHTDQGPIAGVIGRKAVHLQDRDKPEKLTIEDLTIDIGVATRKEAEKLVAVGDPITFVEGMTRLRGELVTSRATDDKVGAFVVMEAARLLKGRKFSAAVHAVSTVQEEIGLRGATTSAFNAQPEVGIAVDVAHASDQPGVEKKRVGEVKVGGGPVLHRGANINPKLGRLLIEVARNKRLPFQLTAEPRATGTDANVMQLSRGGVAAALISIPNRYMHTPVEVVSLADLTNAARLLAEVICALKPEMDFVPGS